MSQSHTPEISLNRDFTTLFQTWYHNSTSRPVHAKTFCSADGRAQRVARPGRPAEVWLKAVAPRQTGRGARCATGRCLDRGEHEFGVGEGELRRKKNEKTDRVLRACRVRVSGLSRVGTRDTRRLEVCRFLAVSGSFVPFVVAVVLTDGQHTDRQTDRQTDNE